MASADDGAEGPIVRTLGSSQQVFRRSRCFVAAEADDGADRPHRTYVRFIAAGVASQSNGVGPLQLRRVRQNFRTVTRGTKGG